MNVRRKGVRARIVLGTGFLSEYTEGGGHWTWFLQYPLGLRALGTTSSFSTCSARRASGRVTSAG